MKEESCSLDCFDAIFVSSCGHFACSKHYFYYKNQGCSLERIKIPVNNKSKAILINFILAIKQKFNYYASNLINPNSHDDSEEYSSRLDTISEAYNYCDRILMFLNRKQLVSTKLIFSPFEYFLIESEFKAEEYVKNFRSPEDLISFYKTFRTYVFDFNYFIFEDQRYIHGWEYKAIYNESHLSSFCYILFCNFIQISEYEMAYELIQSLLSYKEFYYHHSIQEILYICEEFSNILKKLIEKEDSGKLLKEWKRLHIKSSQTNELILKNSLGRVLSAIFGNENMTRCLFNFLLRVKIFCWNFGYEYDAININQELGWLHYNNQNYKNAKRYFMKSIKYHNELKNDEFSELLIEAYRGLALTYNSLKKPKKLKKILKIFDQASLLTKAKFKFYATIGEIYYLLNNHDKAFEIIWMCIKLSKQREFCNSYEVSSICLYLVNIYIFKGDFKKAHQLLFTAKSLMGILPLGDLKIRAIYKAFGVFYLNRKCYKDALEYFESIENYCSGYELLFVKVSIGIAYFYILNNSKALENLVGAKKVMDTFSEVYKNELFIVNSYIGQLCYLFCETKIAHEFFTEAIGFIDSYDIHKIDFFMNSSSYVFSYFYNISDYEKCGIILARINEILKKNVHLKFRLPYCKIQWAELYIALNQTKKAKECLSEAEKLLNIDKIVHNSCENISFNELDCMIDYIELAKIYIICFPEAWQKAEVILKYVVEIVNTKQLNDFHSRIFSFLWLATLYFNKHRWKESNLYFQLPLSIGEYKTIVTKKIN